MWYLPLWLNYFTPIYLRCCFRFTAFYRPRLVQMTDTAKPCHPMIEWRPVTLGIGSSLSLSKRRKSPRATGSVMLASQSNGSSYSRSASTPRLPYAAKTDRYRCRSVTNSSCGPRWKLPTYATATYQAPQVSNSLPKVIRIQCHTATICKSQ